MGDDNPGGEFVRNEGCRGADAEYCGNNNFVYGCSDGVSGIGQGGMSGFKVRDSRLER